MGLCQLIYVSTARDADMDEAELARILESAVRHNSPDGITGMLLYAGGSFMQVLEGEQAMVEATFARVKHDPRHRDVIIIDERQVEARDFSQWRMGFRVLNATDAALHPGYAPFFSHGFDAAEIGARPGVALDMLKDFATNQR